MNVYFVNPLSINEGRLTTNFHHGISHDLFHQAVWFFIEQMFNEYDLPSRSGLSDTDII